MIVGSKIKLSKLSRVQSSVASRKRWSQFKIVILFQLLLHKKHHLLRTLDSKKPKAKPFSRRKRAIWTSQSWNKTGSINSGIMSYREQLSNFPMSLRNWCLNVHIHPPEVLTMICINPHHLKLKTTTKNFWMKMIVILSKQHHHVETAWRNMYHQHLAWFNKRIRQSNIRWDCHLVVLRIGTIICTIRQVQVNRISWSHPSAN